MIVKQPLFLGLIPVFAEQKLSLQVTPTLSAVFQMPGSCMNSLWVCYFGFEVFHSVLIKPSQDFKKLFHALKGKDYK